jgi:hypothetical protein
MARGTYLPPVRVGRVKSCAAPTASLIKVHIDALQLQITVALIRAGRVNAVFVGDDLPELNWDLKLGN